MSARRRGDNCWHDHEGVYTFRVNSLQVRPADLPAHIDNEHGSQVCPNCNEEIPNNNFENHRYDQLSYFWVKCHSLTSWVTQWKWIAKYECNNLFSSPVSKNECLQRKIPCSICELELPMVDMPEHEQWCGSRTELCTMCERWVFTQIRRILSCISNLVLSNHEALCIPSH